MRFRIKNIKFSYGEEFPLLLRGDGIPCFDPTTYIVSQRRTQGLAANTLRRDLQCIALLYDWAESNEIEIDQRFEKCKWLSIQEIDHLVHYCHYNRKVHSKESPSGATAPSNVVSFESHRMRAKDAPKQIKRHTMAVRIITIKKYLNWKANRILSSWDQSTRQFATYLETKKLMIEELDARIPKERGRNDENSRQGLTENELKRLIEIFDPYHDENPWKDYNVRFRNNLIFLTLNCLSLRRGELLGIKVEDINFQENTILIKRRADDPKDTRIRQPNAKTRDRKLPLDQQLANLIHLYIREYRAKITPAKSHPFLFVTMKKGKFYGNPLSDVGYSKIFTDVSNKVPNVPSNLSGHIMRHTFNDRFSKLIDEKGVTNEREQQLRNYNNGWDTTSDTGATYTRRHIKEKGQEVSLELQRKLLNSDE